MEKYPRIQIFLDKIKKNTQNIVSLAKKYDIEINGITKAVCADVEITKAMIEGGVSIIGDSRIENLKFLKENKITKDLMLIRSPMISETSDVIKYCDISLNTEIAVIEKLSYFAKKQKKNHKIVLMIEMGDLREGILKEDFSDFIDKCKNFKNIEIFGVGMNLACYGGIIPTQEKISEFEDFVIKIEKNKNISFQMVSGGNSATIPLFFKNFKKKRITDLRIGEGILLGKETVKRTLIENSYPDTFVLEAEIIELKKKPSIPIGEKGQDAFGNIPFFKDYGTIKRALVAIGKQDTSLEDLIPLDKDLEILGISSDHLILKIDSNKYKVGDSLKFLINYGALLKAFTSKYVKKVYKF